MKRTVVQALLGAFTALGLMTIGCGGTSGTPGSGGSPAGTGGATSGTGGTGTGSGGRSVASGGSTGVNPMTLPLCTTQIRDAACTAGDPAAPDCMVRCGPSVTVETRGYRPLTCGPDTNSATGVGFVQGACYFDPAQNYACHKLPNPTVACPAGTMSGGACTAAPCMPCGDGVDLTKGYVDSGGVPKAGFCLCRPDATGAMTWTCGSNKEYPCYPASPGASVSPGCT